MVDLTHEPTNRDSAFCFENIGKGYQLIGRYKRLRSSGFSTITGLQKHIGQLAAAAKDG